MAKALNKRTTKGLQVGQQIFISIACEKSDGYWSKHRKDAYTIESIEKDKIKCRMIEHTHTCFDVFQKDIEDGYAYITSN